MDGQCFETFLSHCQKYVPPPPWDMLEVSAAYRTPENSSQVFAQLLERHDADSLLCCGLARRDENDRLQLNPLLAPPQAPLVALQGDDGVTNLLTDGGCVYGERRPLFGALDDEHARAAIRGGRQMMVLTADLEDAVVMRALGLIAAPVVGLGELDRHGVGLLEKHYGLRATPDPALDFDDSLREVFPTDESQTESPAEAESLDAALLDDDDDPNALDLVLMKCSPSALSLDEPARVRQAIEGLCELAEFRRIGLREVFEWKLNAEDLRAIRFAESRRDAEWLKDAMLQSLDRSCEILNEALPAAEPESLVGAAKNLNQALSDSRVRLDGPMLLLHAIDDFRRIARKQVIEPFFSEAETESDPYKAAMYLQWAHLHELMLERMTSVRRRCLLEQRLRANQRELERDHAMVEVLKISSQILDYAKELKQWNSHPNRRLPQAAKPAMSLPHFAS